MPAYLQHFPDMFDFQDPLSANYGQSTQVQSDEFTSTYAASSRLVRIEEGREGML